MTHERELDRERPRHTDPVMTELTPPGRASASAALQRPIQPIPSGIVLRKGAGDAEVGAEDALAAASGGAGRALPEELRARFEGSLGVDLSPVRVHTGAESQAAARAVSARAYTVGQDIHFGAGHYDPASASGQHLIAHEVAHTVQQRGGAPARQHKLEISRAGDAFEVEADRAASAMVGGGRAQVSSLGGGGLVQRDEERNPLTGEPVLPRPLYWEGTVIDGDLAGAWSGAPQFTKVAVGDMSPEGLEWVNKVGAMKEAFTGAWNQAQATWNGAVPAYQAYQSAAQDAENKGLADFGGKGSDLDLDTEQEDFGGKTSVSDANLQDHDKLEAGNKTFDRDKVDATLKRKIIDQKTAVRDAGRELDKSERGIDNARGDLSSAGAALATAVGNLKAKQDAKDLQGLNRQIDLMKRSSGAIKTAIEGMAKAADGKFIEAGAKGLELLNTVAWESAILQIEGQAQVLIGGIAQNDIEGADNAKTIAQNQLRKANNLLRDAVDAYKARCGAFKRAHAQLAESLEKAAVASSGSAKVGARVRAAVEAVPLMEVTLTKVSALRDACAPVPETKEAAQGGGMCANGNELVTHVGILASWRQQMSDAAAKWQKRLTLARQLIAQAQ